MGIKKKIYTLDTVLYWTKARIELYNAEYLMLVKLVNKLWTPVSVSTQEDLNTLASLIWSVWSNFIQRVWDEFKFVIPLTLPEASKLKNPQWIPEYIHRLWRMIPNPEYPNYKW